MPRLKLLGSVVLEDDGEPVRGPAARRHPVALLALLARAPSRTLSRSKLVGYLWPRVPEDTARTRLSTHLHGIRRRLGEDVLDSVGGDLRFDESALPCDVCRFEEALREEEYETAVELYDGPFLDGFRLKDAPAFEKWVDRQRDRLRGRYREALEALAEEAEERGDASAAVMWWRERAREDPYDSRVAGRLMEALASVGNRAEALRVADVHARRLEEELDTRAPAELRELAARLREEGRDREAADTRPAPPESEADEPLPPEDGGAGTGAEDRAAADGGAGTGADDPEAPAPGSRPRAPWGLVAVLIGLGATALGAWYLLDADGGPPPETARPTIAVLPFEALGDEDAGLFADGLHGDLLARLSNVAGLEVTARTSTRRFEATDKSVAEIARELGVAWVLEGGIQRVGDEVQVNAQLTDPRTGTHPWAETYRADLTAEDYFDIQGEITREIARSLRARLSDREERRVTARPTDDLEAYRLYVKGRGLLQQRTDPSMREAAEHFRRAIARDSSFAVAWAGLGDALALLAGYDHAPPDSTLPPARNAVRRALELDPDLGEARASLARLHFYRRRLPTALREAERAIELRPSYATAHELRSIFKLTQGRPDEAIESARQSVDLDPLAPENRVALAWAHLARGEAGRALEEARRARGIQPGYDTPVGLEWISLGHLGRPEEALSVLEESVGRRTPIAVAFMHMIAGDTSYARELLSDSATGDLVFVRGLARAALGQREEALDMFLQVFEQQDLWDGGFTIRVRYLHPEVLDPLRADPQFEAFLRKINRAWGLEPDGSLPESDTERAGREGAPGSSSTGRRPSSVTSMLRSSFASSRSSSPRSASSWSAVRWPAPGPSPVPGSPDPASPPVTGPSPAPADGRSGSSPSAGSRPPPP